MNGFSYRGGNLFAEDIPVADLVGGVGTPFYCYSAAALRDSYASFASALEGWMRNMLCCEGQQQSGCHQALLQ